MLKVKDIFGKLKLSKSTKEIMKEVDEELDSKFLKDNGKCRVCEVNATNAFQKIGRLK